MTIVARHTLPQKTAYAPNYGITLDERMLQRLWGHVDVGDDCWLWRSARHHGYGHFYATRTVRAHRLIYNILVGPVPDGLVLDHLCRNRACVNPDHLEPVTAGTNSRRSPLVCSRVGVSA